MEIAKLTSKGQITIPKAVRVELGVDTGDKLIFIPCEGGFFVRNGADFGMSVPSEELAAEIAPAAERQARPAAYRPELQPAYYYDDEDEPKSAKSKTHKDTDKDKDKNKKNKTKK